MKLPVVAIVGRPNVGKSSLLNCLAKRRISIVDATPGVTRDRVSTPLALGEGDAVRYVELVDTGGIGIVDDDNLDEHVEAQITHGIAQASVVLFVVDARDGVTPLDRTVAARLRKQDRPVILLANKMDQANLLAAELGELYALGFGEPLAISATHHQNIDQLHDRLEEAVGEAAVAAPPEEGLKLAIVGKRNAGKSTFINALAGETRVIASERPGTTRDSVDVTLRIDGRPITVIDTAGVKKKRKLADDVEFYSQHRAMRSVRRADVVAMLIDASLPVSQVDKDLAGVVAEHFKPVVIVVNKWDLAEDLTDPDDYAEYFAKTFPALGFAPITFTKATEGFNVRETLALAEQLYQQASCRVPTAQLNEALQAITAHRGPSHKSGTKRPKIYYASQVATNPPTIVCFVNDVRSFDETYIRFLANQFRDHLPFAEVPLRVFVRNRSRENR